MPYKPKKPCAHRGCPELTGSRYCDTHAKQYAREYEKHHRDSAAAKRYGSQWRKIRAAFLSANPLCEICKSEGRFAPADTVHHKKTLADGGTNDWENLQALCSPCHSRLHSKQGDRRGRCRARRT